MAEHNDKVPEEQPPDPECFEKWLCDRLSEERDRDDEIGRVARWVLRENREGRWAPEDVLLARHGHTYDLPAHYGRVLEHVANLSRESIETFFRVYDLYLKDGSAGYDRRVEECERELGEELAEGVGGGGGGNGGGGGTTVGAEDADDEGEKRFSWESWTRFFYELHGREGLGYDVDEDGYPIEEGPTDEGRE